MEVEANIYFWTPGGMRSSEIKPPTRTGYIEVTEVERLLGEAYTRGKREGLSRAEEIINGK